MAEQEQFTGRERQELQRIEKRFKDVGNIRLSLMHREAVRWTERWNKAKYIGACLAVGGEVVNLIGKAMNSDGLLNAGKYARNIGVASTAISWLGSSYLDFYAKDTQIELLVRRESRRR